MVRHHTGGFRVTEEEHDLQTSESSLSQDVLLKHFHTDKWHHSADCLHDEVLSSINRTQNHLKTRSQPDLFSSGEFHAVRPTLSIPFNKKHISPNCLFAYNLKTISSGVETSADHYSLNSDETFNDMNASYDDQSASENESATKFSTLDQEFKPIDLKECPDFTCCLKNREFLPFNEPFEHNSPIFQNCGPFEHNRPVCQNYVHGLTDENERNKINSKEASCKSSVSDEHEDSNSTEPVTFISTDLLTIGSTGVRIGIPNLLELNLGNDVNLSLFGLTLFERSHTY